MRIGDLRLHINMNREPPLPGIQVTQENENSDKNNGDNGNENKDWGRHRENSDAKAERS